VKSTSTQRITHLRTRGGIPGSEKVKGWWSLCLLREKKHDGKDVKIREEETDKNEERRKLIYHIPEVASSFLQDPFSQLTALTFS
jgi:hypothetical protein